MGTSPTRLAEQKPFRGFDITSLIRKDGEDGRPAANRPESKSPTWLEWPDKRSRRRSRNKEEEGKKGERMPGEKKEKKNRSRGVGELQTF